jgi:hypothetical protein
MSRAIPHPPRWAVAALVGAAVALSTGCAKTGKVSGKVTLDDGTPLPGGVISFVPDDPGSNPAAANIREDGTYEVDVPVGTCKVSIDNRRAGQTQTLIGMGGMPTKIGNPEDEKKGGKGPGGPPGGPGDKMAAMMAAAKKGSGGGAPPVPKDAQERLAQASGGSTAPTAVTPVPGRAVPIDPKYYTPETSGLTLKVSGGSNTFDVRLAPGK